MGRRNTRTNLQVAELQRLRSPKSTDARKDRPVQVKANYNPKRSVSLKPCQIRWIREVLHRPVEPAHLLGRWGIPKGHIPVIPFHRTGQSIWGITSASVRFSRIVQSADDLVTLNFAAAPAHSRQIAMSGISRTYCWGGDLRRILGPTMLERLRWKGL